MRMSGQAFISAFATMINTYCGILRDKYPNFPNRKYARKSNGHSFKIKMSVGKFIRLENGECPGPINVEVKFDGETVCYISVPETMLSITQGFNPDSAKVDFCMEHELWDEFLVVQLYFLEREAQIYR